MIIAIESLTTGSFTRGFNFFKIYFLLQGYVYSIYFLLNVCLKMWITWCILQGLVVNRWVFYRNVCIYAIFCDIYIKSGSLAKWIILFSTARTTLQPRNCGLSNVYYRVWAGSGLFCPRLPAWNYLFAVYLSVRIRILLSTSFKYFNCVNPPDQDCFVIPVPSWDVTDQTLPGQE